MAIHGNNMVDCLLSRSIRVQAPIRSSYEWDLGDKSPSEWKIFFFLMTAKHLNWDLTRRDGNQNVKTWRRNGACESTRGRIASSGGEMGRAFIPLPLSSPQRSGSLRESPAAVAARGRSAGGR